MVVPHRLEQTARRQHALVHTEVRQARDNFSVDGVGHGQFKQGVDGQCHWHSFGTVAIGRTVASGLA
ncbi:hypothetical protein, partial [Pseudomonas kitaguniensis]|uniref:hypothetical protein n=1 Tax=Pseudomonas kitaguniensis TaxID=2607908 RepID=UPI0031344F73